jgi:hypothetical protein
MILKKWKEITIDQSEVWSRHSPVINEENHDKALDIFCSDGHCKRALPEYRPVCKLDISSALFNDAIPVCASNHGGSTVLKQWRSHQII